MQDRATMSKMQILLTTTVLLFGISGSGVAGFDDGLVAAGKGDYNQELLLERSIKEIKRQPLMNGSLWLNKVTLKHNTA